MSRVVEGVGLANVNGCEIALAIHNSLQEYGKQLLWRFRWLAATMLFGGVAIYTCEPSMAPIQLGNHCLVWKAAVTLANLRPTGQAMRCSKLLLMAEQTCRKIPCTVDFPRAALSATKGMGTPCMSLNNATTTFFSCPMGCLQCVCCL